MKLFVDIKNYTPFSYHQYLKRGKEVPKPKNPKYSAGQVVVIHPDGKYGQPRMAVVLGCIDETHDAELRLDLCGMTPIDEIRPAKKSDLKDPNIECMDKLRAECEGKKVHYDWRTYELTIQEP